MPPPHSVFQVKKFWLLVVKIPLSMVLIKNGLIIIVNSLYDIQFFHYIRPFFMGPYCVYIAFYSFFCKSSQRGPFKFKTKVSFGIKLYSSLKMGFKFVLTLLKLLVFSCN